MGPSGLVPGAGVPQPRLVPLCLPISCSDDEKSRQMWRRYQEREDSRISGEQGCGERRAGLGAGLETWGLTWLCPILVPPDLFVGQLKSSLTCSECGYCSTAFDPFWDLSLPIPKVRGALNP